ncbi:23S rRNA (adenine(1618)-N(6))-methyltransferase RlmF [Tenacibaculum dicentrarchi]|nr:23S rRNA (adenine(1618)-N(6))-methyltransferase RlmF [Tenacibaculum dicentrarchi]MCD8408286.1 23S rRNA (adenine(1618)-N(6))-methyltransferase RlmF [Tenacibaculum dicentrarchi]MCD8415618.1 23S rRNA (adenine(1618)-N(6))-methyltransferase RlmF [Tenacibaculum dicentrarchi]MCD8420799.1 23S rRNA (adenine(1618)-N(6))-methyltransferase RlmF [Tenacibaculum dicentrarchi]MCD8425527.1 23S rRNA (adenine(1618)-N(6))-methyltransferase RlmF [Tenacibaculum dicentrarchi]
MENKKGLHENNKHKNGYDFKFLKEKYPQISAFVIEKFDKETIDFSDPVAVKEFNKALLFAYYNIKDWNFPDENLCPPIPGRVDYIHHLADLITDEKDVTVLDIGTGASCVYPLLGASVYNWNFVATDIDLDSLDYSQDIIDDNNLDAKIKLRQQFDELNVLKGITEEDDAFTLTMCNPPFYKSEEEARGANRRKSRNLGNNTVRNFAGNSNELWYLGGEKAFLHTYLYESSLQPELSKWFTSLVSKKENVKSLQDSAKKLKVKEFKIIPMSQGNKVTRIVCWKF